MAADEVNEEAVYKCTGGPRPCDMEEIAQWLFNEDFVTCFNSKPLFIFLYLSLQLMANSLLNCLNESICSLTKSECNQSVDSDTKCNIRELSITTPSGSVFQDSVYPFFSGVILRQAARSMSVHVAHQWLCSVQSERMKHFLSVRYSTQKLSVRIYIFIYTIWPQELQLNGKIL